MMNQTAQRLGMTQTSYVNPNGLPADGQITSARDLAILARAVIRDLPEYEYFMHIPAIRFGRRVTHNFNKLIGRYPGADGFKTGFICASGYNLVASATRNGKRLIAVVLGSSSGQARAVRAAQLLERGFANNGLSWLRPSLGTVDNLAPIDASPPNLRDEMCGGKRKRPASDEDDGRSQPARRHDGDRRRSRRDVLHRRTAAADGEAVGTAGGGARGRRADGRLHRPEEDRRGPDRRRCGGLPRSRPRGSAARSRGSRRRSRMPRAEPKAEAKSGGKPAAKAGRLPKPMPSRRAAAKPDAAAKPAEKPAAAAAAASRPSPRPPQSPKPRAKPAELKTEPATAADSQRGLIRAFCGR